MRITSEQIDKIMAYIEQHPALSPENTATFDVDIAQFQESFNAAITPYIEKAQLDGELREVMEKLFLIDEYQTFDVHDGKFFFNIFGDSVGIFGVTNHEDQFKILLCIYNTPEDKNNLTLSSLVLASFTKVLLPNEIDVEKFLRELSTSGTKIQGGVKFSIAADGKLIFVTATEEATT